MRAAEKKNLGGHIDMGTITSVVPESRYSAEKRALDAFQRCRIGRTDCNRAGIGGTCTESP